jgi:hypothetical protein
MARQPESTPVDFPTYRKINIKHPHKPLLHRTIQRMCIVRLCHFPHEFLAVSGFKHWLSQALVRRNDGDLAANCGPAHPSPRRAKDEHASDYYPGLV